MSNWYKINFLVTFHWFSADRKLVLQVTDLCKDESSISCRYDTNKQCKETEKDYKQNNFWECLWIAQPMSNLWFWEEIPDRKECHESGSHTQIALTDRWVCVGICKTKTLINLVIHATVFQVEVAVIQYCAREILEQAQKIRPLLRVQIVKLHLKAISSEEFKWRVWHNLNDLSQLDSHNGDNGNEFQWMKKIEWLKKVWTRKMIRTRIKKWLQRESQYWWSGQS